jgi:hypothetical protein
VCRRLSRGSVRGVGSRSSSSRVPFLAASSGSHSIGDFGGRESVRVARARNVSARQPGEPRRMRRQVPQGDVGVGAGIDPTTDSVFYVDNSIVGQRGENGAGHRLGDRTDFEAAPGIGRRPRCHIYHGRPRWLRGPPCAVAPAADDPPAIVRFPPSSSLFLRWAGRRRYRRRRSHRNLGGRAGLRCPQSGVAAWSVAGDRPVPRLGREVDEAVPGRVGCEPLECRALAVVDGLLVRGHVDCQADFVQGAARDRGRDAAR